MEIDGKKLDRYNEINLRSIKTKENPFGEGRTPTQQCEEFIQQFAPKKKDKLNEKIEQLLVDYVEKTTDVESLAQFTKDITDNCITFDENTSTFGVNGIPVKDSISRIRISWLFPMKMFRSNRSKSQRLWNF